MAGKTYQGDGDSGNRTGPGSGVGSGVGGGDTQGGVPVYGGYNQQGGNNGGGDMTIAGPAAPDDTMADPSITDPYWSQYFRNGFGNLPKLPQYDTSAADAARAQQMLVIQELQRQAAGDPSSRAQQNLQQANQTGQGQQRALAASQRGVSAGAQMRQGNQGAGIVQSQQAGQSKELMLREQQAAQQQLAAQYAAMQNGDINQAQNMAGTNLQGQALNDAMNQFFAGQGAQTDINNWQQNFDYGSAMLGDQTAATNVTNQYTQGAINAGVQGAGTIASLYAQMGGGNQGQGYKQIDGQNSIMPYGEK